MLRYRGGRSLLRPLPAASLPARRRLAHRGLRTEASAETWTELMDTLYREGGTERDHEASLEGQLLRGPPIGFPFGHAGIVFGLSFGPQFLCLSEQSFRCHIRCLLVSSNLHQHQLRCIHRNCQSYSWRGCTHIHIYTCVCP